MTDHFYPDSLKRLPIWGLWRIERNEKGKPTKVPYSAHYNGRASSTNPDAWGNFDQVVRKYASNPDFYDGIALVISKDYGLLFIDIDHCIDANGEMSGTAVGIIDSFEGQYMEFSQSGSGVHIITKGTVPKSFKNSQNGVEMYIDKRFCALTGNAFRRYEPTEEQSVIDEIYQRYKPPEAERKCVKTSHRTLQNSDRWVIDHASGRGRFDDLYSGRWTSAGYASQSEADLSLCLILAFWTDCDADQIDRIFRSSGLYREKWERDDYRQRTIQNAIDQCEEPISEYIRRSNREGGERLDRELREIWDN